MSDKESLIPLVSAENSPVVDRLAVIEAWTPYDAVAKGWGPRAKLAASLIPPGVRIIDLGCGNQLLRTFLKSNASYTPADIAPRTPETLIIDLNDGKWPVGKWDWATALGVLEYIYDVDDFFRGMNHLADHMLFTYHVETVKGSYFQLADTVARGWVNHHSMADLVVAYEAAGWVTVKVSAFQCKKHYWQYIFVLRKIDP